MPTTHIIGFADKDGAKTAALAYQGKNYHTLVIDAAGDIEFTSHAAEDEWPADFGTWIVIATNGKIEAAAAAAPVVAPK